MIIYGVVYNPETNQAERRTVVVDTKGSASLNIVNRFKEVLSENYGSDIFVTVSGFRVLEDELRRRRDSVRYEVFDFWTRVIGYLAR